MHTASSLVRSAYLWHWMWTLRGQVRKSLTQVGNAGIKASCAGALQELSNWPASRDPQSLCTRSGRLLLFFQRSRVYAAPGAAAAVMHDCSGFESRRSAALVWSLLSSGNTYTHGLAPVSKCKILSKLCWGAARLHDCISLRHAARNMMEWELGQGMPSKGRQDGMQSAPCLFNNWGCMLVVHA